jgi:hypothetical protein
LAASAGSTGSRRWTSRFLTGHDGDTASQRLTLASAAAARMSDSWVVFTGLTR